MRVEEYIQKIDSVRKALGMEEDNPLWNFSFLKKYGLENTTYELLDHWLTGQSPEKRRFFFEAAGKTSLTASEPPAILMAKHPDSATIYHLAEIVEYLFKEWPRNGGLIAPDEYKKDVTSYTAIFAGNVIPVLAEAMKHSKNRYARLQAVRYAKAAGVVAASIIGDLDIVAGKDERVGIRESAKNASREISDLMEKPEYRFLLLGPGK